MFNPAYALMAAVFWAISPIYYRIYLAKFDFLSFNLLRTSVSATVLAVPALYFWNWSGLGLAFLSGVTTLACGDSLFLLSIRETSASVATPVVYTYVLMVQLVGAAIGQAIPFSNFASALMVVAGVYILSRGGGGKPRARGIVLAVSAGMLWAVGQEFIQASTNAGGALEPVTFTRNLAAAVALGTAVLVTRRHRSWPRGIGMSGYAFIAGIIVSDLVVGSLLFVYSVSTIGVAISVILTSLSPLLTQVLAKALGKESPAPKDFLGGVLIVSALILAVAL